MHKTLEQSIFNWRFGPIAQTLREIFYRVMQQQNGVWQDQLFILAQDHHFLGIHPVMGSKYLDNTKVTINNCELLLSVEPIEAVYAAVRELELKDGMSVKTLNLCYIGPSSWGGDAFCVPFVYSKRLNDLWTIESQTIDNIAALANQNIISILRDHYYGVSNISLVERTRILTSKGYRILDSKDVTKKNLTRTIVAING